MIKELEDYNWFPQMFRKFQMEFIGSMIQWASIYQPLITLTNATLNENKVSTIVDLCSGSGLPAIYLQKHLSNNCNTVLSDKFPDKGFVNTSSIIYLKETTDVLLLEPKPATCYTMYNALHHFSDNDKVAIINKLRIANAPFIFAEILEPNLLTLLKIIFTTTVLQLLTTPFVQPFSFLRLFFTYVVPINLFTITYDGVISVFKSRTVEQYKNLVVPFSNKNLEITVNKISSWKSVVIYIKGNPKK